MRISYSVFFQELGLKKKEIDGNFKEKLGLKSIGLSLRVQ